MIYESDIKSFRHKTIQLELPKPFPKSRLPKYSVCNLNNNIFQESVMVNFCKMSKRLCLGNCGTTQKTFYICENYNIYDSRNIVPAKGWNKNFPRSCLRSSQFLGRLRSLMVVVYHYLLLDALAPLSFLASQTPTTIYPVCVVIYLCIYRL